MSGWTGNIERATLDNDTFRTVVATGAHLQLVVMSLGPDDEVIEKTIALGEDWACIIPAGRWHNVINCGHGPLKLYSIYSPPEHPDGTVHTTKADADADEHEL